METKAHYALVGFFAIALAAAIVVFVLWLGQLRFDREFAEYDIVFDGAARGLREASEVQFNGIKVGEVTALALVGAQGERVIARVRVNAVTPVSCDSVGRLEPLGVTGVNYIQLLPRGELADDVVASEDQPGGLADIPQPMPMDRRDVDFSSCTPRGTGVPRIRGEQSPLDALFEGGGGVVTEAQQLVALLSRELEANAESIRVTLSELRGVSEEIGAHDELLLNQAESAMFELNGRLEEIGETIELVNELIRSTNTLMTEQVGPTLEALQRISEGAAALVASVNDVVDRSSGPTVEGVEQLALAMNDLRALIARFDAIARDIEDNPAGFVAGPRRREVEIPE